MVTILVHGGAGRWDRQRAKAPVSGVRAAADAGVAHLRAGEPALAAVVAAVSALEDDPTFNAGTGSSLTLDGRAEMDAAVMTGIDRATGAVAAVDRVRHPVRVARAVRDHTDHCLLGGDGARRFARALGFADHDPVTAAARRRWRRHRERLAADDEAALPRLASLLRAHPELAGDTVGAVAVDAAGGLAVATSTGGVSLKLPGRIGDSPLAGAGFYADEACAVAATGRGELMIRSTAARAVTERVRAGDHPQAAVAAVLAEVAAGLGQDAGLIAVDAHGRTGIGHRTRDMPHALASDSAATSATLGRG